MAAANDRIGAARAAFFPRLDITGYAGFESSELGNLFQWSSRAFLLGPLTGAMLSLPVFDAGRRQAGVDRARAVYEEDVANYRQTVLGAFREVEDNLANLRILADQTRAQDAAVESAARAAKLSHTQYREGSISYLDVIVAQNSLISARSQVATADQQAGSARVDVFKALGGGWQASSQD